MKRLIQRLLISVMTALLILLAAACSKTAPPPEASGSSAPVSGQPAPSESGPPASPSPSTSGGDLPTDSSAPDPSAEKDYLALGDTLLQKDGIGSVKVNMTASALVKQLGEPDSKSDPELWGADGLEHSDWVYSSKGLTVNMAQQPDDGEAIVFSLFAAAPCTLTTQRGVTIGTSKDTVLSSYVNEIDTSANPDTSTRILIGSIYAGIVMDIENGVVKDIFVGASSE